MKGAPRRLPPAIEENLLHIGREALTNAVKHARASGINVELKFERESVRLSVKDDGCGFDAQHRSLKSDWGFGLISMRERAEQIGARLDIQSSTDKGTIIVAEVSG